MEFLSPDPPMSAVAAAIAEPARTRMLYCLMDGRARTSTELAMVAEVSPSTASVHLSRLRAQHLVKVIRQGKCRYYSLEGPQVATALEALTVIAGAPRGRYVPNTPLHLRAARSCYDHLAGALGVALHRRFQDLGWFRHAPEDGAYELTPEGTEGFEELGMDLPSLRAQRRRFACACLDWSERRPHLAGALGAAFLAMAIKHRWLNKQLDSRALSVTPAGRREFSRRFGLKDW
ncbi:MAG: ArsR/SmtB family transcription factor [Bacillota bacterium]